MPVHTAKRGKRWVVTDAAGKTYGSHSDKQDAVKQAQAININEGLTPLTPKRKKNKT